MAKGLSADEKKAKLLAFFQDEYIFYNMKEIETVGSKKTGISSMQIKEVLQHLLDDNLINCEKCGVTNLYWSFKDQQEKDLNEEFERLRDKRSKYIENLNQLEKSLKRETSLRINNDTRRSLKEEVSKLRKRKRELDEELQLISLNDPIQIELKYQKIKQYRDKIEQNVENITLLLQYFRNDPANPVPSADLMHLLNIPLGFEDSLDQCM